MSKVSLSLSELEVFDPKNKNNRFCCPLCGNSKSIESKHRSLWVDRKNGGWFCHRCNNKGLLLEWQTQPYSSNKRNFSSSPQPKVIDENKIKQVREEYSIFAKGFAYSPGQHYLSSRGIKAQLAKESGCGFGYWKHWIEDNGAFTCIKDRRVCFPIRNQSNEVVAISARAIGDDGIDPTHTVRGYKSLGVFTTAGALESDVLLITESPIDALSLAMAGFPSIATIGTSWPDWLVELASKKSFVVVAFDNDAAGNLATTKFLDQLSTTNAIAKKIVPSLKDWNKILTTYGLDSLKSEVDSFISNCYLPIVPTAEIIDREPVDYYRFIY